MTLISMDGISPGGRKLRNLATVATAAVLALVTIWLYWPARHFDFVNWDDPWYVLKNPLIQSWSLENLKAIATESVIRNYAPLTMFSFLLDWTFFGEWAGGYHLVNVLLHSANAVLVFLLIRQLTGRPMLAAATAMLFAVHPVHVESVAWISSRKGLLSGAFILASLLCWLREERTPRQEVWGIVFLFAALLCKAIAVVVPAVVLTYDLFVRRNRFSDAFVRQIIPGMLSVWILLANMSAQVTMLGGVRGHFELSRLEILAVDLLILWRYVGMLLCPQDLCVLYDPPTAGIWGGALLAGCGWLIACWWIWKNRSDQPLVFLAGVSWIVFLIPVLNLFPITTLMNDRYLYLPSIPALALAVGMVGLMMQKIGERFFPRMSWAIAGLLMLLVASGLIQRTRDYLPVWQNDLALWEHAAQQAPSLPVVQIQRALSLYNAGHTEGALRTLDFALAHCEPDEMDRERILAKQAEWQAGK
jgi:protein O-mannosyl-transferase